MSESANRDAQASQLLKAGNPEVFRGFRGLGSRALGFLGALRKGSMLNLGFGGLRFRLQASGFSA